MTGSGTTKPRGGEGDLDFDLDEALDEWEAEFESALSAESAPIGGPTRDASGSRTAPIAPYRPPSPKTLAEPSGPREERNAAFSGPAEGASTRVSPIPRDVSGGGTAADDHEDDDHEKATLPPPEGPRTDTLDITELLAGLDEETDELDVSTSEFGREPDLEGDEKRASDDAALAWRDDLDEPELTLSEPPPGEPELTLSEPPPTAPALGAPSAPPIPLTAPKIKPAAVAAPASFGRGSDIGALAAKRTVHARKPRHEVFPLVGETMDALRMRRELLNAIAERSRGAHKARALVAAAELSEQLGEVVEAEALYRHAVSADGRDLIALRALRRYAITNGDFAEARKLLETESGLALSSEDKALALLSMAEIQLRRLDDPTGAERSARTASAIAKGSSRTALLLLAEACRQQGRDADAYTALEKSLDAIDDPALKSTFALLIGAAAERAGQSARARHHYAMAAELEPGSLDVWFAVARASRASGELAQAVDALGKATAIASDGLKELIERLRALLLVEDGRPSDALDVLASASSAIGHATRAKVAELAGDDETCLDALARWAESTFGTERAWALSALAERRAARGDLDGADAALRDAALADENLGIVRIVRERLAKETGDTTRFGSDANVALIAAAKLAARRADEAQERALLETARDGSDSPIAADVVSLDAAARSSDGDALRRALLRRAERLVPEQRLGPLLALSDLHEESGDRAATIEVVRHARDRGPDDLLLARHMGFLLGDAAPREAATCFLDALVQAQDAHAATLAATASRLLPDGDEARADALRRALEAHRGHRPAAWMYERWLRTRGDVEALGALEEELAETSTDPLDASARWARSALLRFERDAGAAAELLERARTARPDDPIPYELLLRLGDTTSAAARAELLETLAAHGPPEAARATLVRAASLWEAAEEPARSIALLRGVRQGSADPITLRLLEQSELQCAELAPVAERRFQAVREAQTDRARVVALEALAELDLHERNDPGSAVLSLESILEIVPDHLPALRGLETYFMAQRRDEDLAWIEERIAAAVANESDVAAHGRLAARLRLAVPTAEGSAADELFLGLADRAPLDPWLSRRIEGAARARGDRDRQARASVAIAASLPGAIERASAKVLAANALHEAGRLDEALDVLRDAVATSPDHPVAAEELARREEDRGAFEAAAMAYEMAGHAAAVPSRAAALHYRAGVLFEDQLGSTDRALAAYERAAQREITYRDLFDRMKRILASRDETAKLADLIRRRLAAGGDPDALVDLHLARADLCERLGDREGARDAYRAALGLEPDRLDALRQLANLCLEDEDWRGAAEALIRSARLQKDREELRWVFFSLGHIYARHMPDPERAVTAFRRAIRLSPDDFESMECLAELHRRLGQYEQAVEVYQQLTLRDPDVQRARNHRLKLAEVFEVMGDLRRAEAELEGARRSGPTDAHILRTVADFYRRQRADAALAMHLGRATSDYRVAIAREPADADAWTGLVEVLGARNRPDAARCCASAAAAMGHLDIELARLLDARGGIPGSGATAADASLEELLAPAMLSAPVRRAFRLAGEVFDKIFPFDLRALSAERASRDAPIRAEAEQVSKMLGHDVEVWITSAAPRAFVPVSGTPGVIVVGRELLTVLEPAERMFLLVRAAKLAQSGLSISVRTDPGHLALAVSGLIRAFDPTHAPRHVDPMRLEEVAKRIQKAVPRKSREALASVMYELAGIGDAIPGQLGAAAAELGDRTALLALGSLPSALRALLRVSAEPLPTSEAPSAEAIQRGSETWSLLLFAISDAYFEARDRTGASRIAS